MSVIVLFIECFMRLKCVFGSVVVIVFVILLRLNLLLVGGELLNLGMLSVMIVLCSSGIVWC